ncbi:glycine--tRNA ligase subunit beta [Nitrosomonas sp. Is37]|uniref:glycine--tRNA ligase subunit beta n=1 Tax=Nitrosomonas sp. Is37 TaxID=3080535 RepID=UPI00294AD392|nr:glycine--tRNA ligase subunit beta [Nitrosomonas sp. Is37]MDV6344140.1 glycine--tRNA ligase subunit beta [Nitrosomonas sp. Is37]
MIPRNLLIELLVEELPPKSLHKLSSHFAESLLNSLKSQNLAMPDAVVTAYATPRRLAAHITHVLVQAPDQAVTTKLMPVSVGLDQEGRATPALVKKLSSLGVEAFVVSQLTRAMEGKSETLFLERVVPGIVLADGLQQAINDAIAQLPIPKVMTYQLADGWESVNFVRPAHGLIALHDAEVVPVSVLGLIASNVTQGHRFEASIHPIVIREADSYSQQLETEGAVIASFTERRTRISNQLSAAAAKENLQLIQDEALLDEVTALVEHPNVLIGKFPSEFLEVPQECLILTMKANQKYFPLLDSDGKLANTFLIVANICPADTHFVVDGNERVVRSRLADAKFFFDQDRKNTLASRIPGLDKVVYHHQLGTQGLRIEYVRIIACDIGQMLGGNILAEQAEQAARLAKTDLLTDMVGEFPELQGIMGRYYAQHEGLSDAIAYAIEDHYKPRFSGDSLPRNLVGVCVALADKLETLINLFAIGQLPTGDKDPFALRRHALGVIRILIEKDLPLEMNRLLERVIEILQDERIAEQWAQRTVAETPTTYAEEKAHQKNVRHEISAEVSGQLSDFIYDRLAVSLREQGYSAQEVDAVLALHPQHLNDIPKRLAAIRAFAALPEAASLAAANKRVSNILKKVSAAISSQVDVELLQAPAEQALYQALIELKDKVDKAFHEKDYTVALQILAALKAPVDAFFDHVMVNTDDDMLRNNRLALLKKLQLVMNRVADISRLAS